MNNNSDIQKQVHDTLDSLNGIQRAEPIPFLFTRVMARINNKQNSVWEKLSYVFSKPAVAFATVILFIAINAVVLFSVAGNSPSAPQEPALMAGNDFGLSVNSIYDINPEQNDIVQK